MKPSDFYLSSRQIFGTLIPGMVWIVTFSAVWKLMVAEADFPKLELPTTGPALIGIFLSVLFSAFVIGLLLHSRSFKVTEYFASFLKDRCETEELEKFRIDVREILRAHQPAVVTQNLARKTADGKNKWWRRSRAKRKLNENLFQTCKRSVICRSPELLRLLLEREDEINVYGMLPLPMFVLVLAASFQTGAKIHGLWAFLPLGIAIYSVFQFQRSRVDEERDCYTIFLLLETDLSGKVRDIKVDSSALERIE